VLEDVSGVIYRFRILEFVHIHMHIMLGLLLAIIKRICNIRIIMVSVSHMCCDTSSSCEVSVYKAPVCTDTYLIDVHGEYHIM
jgi:hypothetical protein